MNHYWKKGCILLTLSAMALGQVGCATTSDASRTQKGAVMGGVGGAIVGGLIGGRKGNAGKGALIGGLLGAATGGVVGNFSASGAARLPELTLAATDGSLVLDTAKFTFSGIPVEQRRPSRLELSKGILTIADATWSVAENPLVLAGSIGVAAEDPPHAVVRPVLRGPAVELPFGWPRLLLEPGDTLQLVLTA